MPNRARREEDDTSRVSPKPDPSKAQKNVQAQFTRDEDRAVTDYANGIWIDGKPMAKAAFIRWAVLWAMEQKAKPPESEVA